jgi:hypothetical protein
MTAASLEVAPMSRKAEPPVGPILAENLLRLGYADIVVRASEVSRLVSERTGKAMSRQRVSAIMNAVRVDAETVSTLAEAIGVEPEELTRKR